MDGTATSAEDQIHSNCQLKWKSEAEMKIFYRLPFNFLIIRTANRTHTHTHICNNTVWVIVNFSETFSTNLSKILRTTSWDFK